MTDLILLPTLERLRPYDKPGLTTFGMTFSVALGGAGKLAELGDLEKPARSFLKPWSWKPEGEYFLDIQKVRLFSVNGAAPPETRDFILSKGLLTKLQREELERALEARFKLFEDSEKDSFSPWLRSSGSTIVTREQRPWPAFLGQVSLYPYPLPQGLQLSLLLDLATDLGPQVVAAPVLRLKRDGAVIELIPELKAGTKDPVVLEYGPEPPPLAAAPPGDPAAPAPPAASEQTTPNIPLIAHTMPCDTGPASQKISYFDFEKLWIKLGDADIAGTEWRAGLELRLAEQLHVARTVVEWMKKNKTNPDLVKSYPEMVWFTLRQLRPVLGPGLRQGLDGSLLKRVSSIFKLTIPEGFVADTKGWFGKVSDPQWLGWLRQVITGSPLADGATGARLLDAAIAEKPEEAIERLLTFDEAVAELDQILASMAAPETVRALFKLQWTEYVDDQFKTSGSTGKERLARLLAADLPPEIDLQRLLLLDHLGEHWDDFQQAFAGSPSLEDVRTRLQKVYVEILTELKAPVWKDSDVTALGKEFKDRVLPEPARLDSLERPGTRGLTFQLDTLAQDPGETDLLQHMQGVAVLMRRKSDPNWHCLNLAAAKIGSTSIDPVLIPSRIAYMNDLRSPTVTYDNAPLTVEGPLSAAEVAGAELDPGDRAREKIDEPLIEFTHSTKGKIPGLVFGETYEVKPFLVTNSGAIPAALADGNPWQVNLAAKSLDGPDPISRPYLREAHIGALRFLSAEASGLPPIPANVAPQVRELASKDVFPPDDFGDKKDLGAASTPLLLLAPLPEKFSTRPGVKLRQDFKFKILPPTVDLQTWDRWVAKDDKDPEKRRRKFIWRSFYELAYDKGLDERKLEDAGVYLDDPAVEGLWVELAQLAETGNYTVLGSGKLQLKKRNVKPDFSAWESAECTLETEQNQPIEVSCSLDDAEKLRVTAGDVTLGGTGRLFRLSFYATVKAGDEKLFKEKEYVRPEGTSPWHLLIEVPQKLKPSPELKSALRDALKPKHENDKLTVSLDLSRNDLKELHGLIYRAELLHQVWSWRGRPPVPTPDPSKLDTDPKRLAFEMSEFGERTDDEHRRLPMPRMADAKGPEPFFRYEENLAEQGPQGDLRALYHRFSARVFSRWEGILPEEDASLEALDKATQNWWQPLLVPCRHVGRVPVPKVKLVLPLTQAESEDATRGPGLLVVTDGPWYEVGGLAEELDVEVMEVTGPDKIHYHQAGTDPIVTGDSAGKVLEQTQGALEAGKYKFEFTPQGAIGHHRDSSQAAPRFLASSFLLPPPKISLKQSGKVLEKPLAWWFFKLRFRRKLQLPKDETVSDWSAPFWVQLLPGVERIEEDWFGSSDLEVLLSAKGQLCVKGKSAHDPKDRFHLFGVMTRKVIDFAGRPDQEVYLGVWWQDQGSWTTDIKTFGSSAGLYVRWIEVQSPRLPKIANGDALWNAIFSPNQADAERARIVRISKRFSIQSGSC